MSETLLWSEETLTLIERKHEYGAVDTYIFESLHTVPFEAGQYGHVRLSGMPPEEKAVREFSFASAPHDSSVWFGIDSRSGSPYQLALKALVPGDTVRLFKIKGHMHWPPEPGAGAVMIAGGVGVTPFRSMLRDSLHTSGTLPSALIHIGSEFLYGEEFEKMPVEYLRGNRDTLAPLLARQAGQDPDATFYVAGSPGFVRAVVVMLSSLGIQRIESDEFKGLLE